MNVKDKLDFLNEKLQEFVFEIEERISQNDEALIYEEELDEHVEDTVEWLNFLSEEGIPETVKTVEEKRD